jgi:endonuclease G
VIGDGNVAVLTHFYKIVVDANSTGHVEALAFVIPNENQSGHRYSEYLASIDEIEKATGLDFLSALSADEQREIESEPADRAW